MSGENGCKVVVGLEKMASKIDISRSTLIKFIQLGMPARKIGGMWVFHLDNVMFWFQKTTLAKNVNVSAQEFEEEK